MQHALTFDLEDWHQLVHRRVTGRTIEPTRHVVNDTHRVLDLLAEAEVRATFFVVGQVAEKYPQLIREVAESGHEVGSHTYAHELIWTQTPQRFRVDVSQSRKQLQDLTGQTVSGFRAPEFSVGNLRHWCFDVLAQEGFTYDSSVVPATSVRYGIPEAPIAPFPLGVRDATVWEFPLPVWRIGGALRPVGGGSYFRFLPLRLLRVAIAGYEAARRPAVLYFHPYEFHRGVLRLDELTVHERLSLAYFRLRLLHNFRPRAAARSLRGLLLRFNFGPLGRLRSAVSSLDADAGAGHL